MKIICIAQNYKQGVQVFDNEMVVFLKPDTALHNLELPYYIPTFVKELYYEPEIVVKINQNGKFIAEKFASKYYDEISIGIDFSAYDIQESLKKNGLPWERAKAFDGSAIVGKFVDKTKVKNLENISFSLQKNQEISAYSSGEMLRGIDKIISEVSEIFTLRKGDLIFTGSPMKASKVHQGDLFEGFVEDEKLFSVLIK